VCDDDRRPRYEPSGVASIEDDRYYTPDIIVPILDILTQYVGVVAIVLTLLRRYEGNNETVI
jgi:hypothetical protein